jgi:hypothetical protein
MLAKTREKVPTLKKETSFEILVIPETIISSINNM